MWLSLKYILESVQGTLLSGDVNAWVEGISTDSRRYDPKQVFLPLRAKTLMVMIT